MRLFLFFSALLSVGFVAAKENKPCLKVLIAADTVTKNIRLGSISDVARMTKSFHGIAAQTGLRLRLTVLKDSKFNPQNIQSWIQTLSSKDICFCYYTGHGVRVPQITSRWPCIVFPKKTSNKVKALAGSLLLKRIKKRHSRLAIIFFDCCNLPVSFKAASLSDPNQQLVIGKKPALPGLKNLFLHTKGMIAACAATQGEAALTVIRAEPQGGLFTTGFLATLHYFGQENNLSWKQVFDINGKLCTRLTNGSQHPFSIQIK